MSKAATGVFDLKGPCQVACVRTEPLLQELEEPNSPMQVYKFSLPALDLMGLLCFSIGHAIGGECQTFRENGLDAQQYHALREIAWNTTVSCDDYLLNGDGDDMRGRDLLRETAVLGGHMELSCRMPYARCRPSLPEAWAGHLIDQPLRRHSRCRGQATRRDGCHERSAMQEGAFFFRTRRLIVLCDTLGVQIPRFLDSCSLSVWPLVFFVETLGHLQRGVHQVFGDWHFWEPPGEYPLRYWHGQGLRLWKPSECDLRLIVSPNCIGIIWAELT